MSASLLEVSGWKDRAGKVWRLLEDVPHSEVPAATPLYSQATVDTLRAQLEAAELGEHRAHDEQPTWAEITQHWKARAEAAEANAARYEWLRVNAEQIKAARRELDWEWAESEYVPDYSLDAAIDAAMARTKEETK